MHKSKRHLLILSAALASVAACNVDVMPPAREVEAGVAWRGLLNHRAIALSTQSPYDTITLEFHAVGVDGSPALSGGKTTYVSRDRNGNVMVDSTGHVRALAPTTGVWIVATHQTGVVSLVDSAVINVTATPVPNLSGFSIQPLLGDSAKIAVAVRPNLFVPQVPLDKKIIPRNNGVPITGVPIRFWSSDPIAASITEMSGDFRGRIPDRRVTLYATTTVNGVAWIDSLQYTIGLPLLAVVDPKWITPVDALVSFARWPSSRIAIGVGGTVFWSSGPTSGDPEIGYLWGVNTEMRPMDVIFDDTTGIIAPTIAWPLSGDNTGSGNIPPFMMDTLIACGGCAYPGSRGRSFIKAGTYRFRSSSVEGEAELIVR